MRRLGWLVHGGMTLACLAAALLVGASCAHGPYTWVDSLPEEAIGPEPYRIRAGDDLQVQVWNQEQLTTDAHVRRDGKITVMLLGDLPVAGLTPQEAADLIAERLDGIVVEPRVSVSVKEDRIDHVTVIGEVENAGRYPVERGETVLHLLAKAGGLTDFADPEGIYVIRREPEPMRVRFSYSKLAGGLGRGLSFTLRDGDVIYVE